MKVGFIAFGYFAAVVFGWFSATRLSKSPADDVRVPTKSNPGSRAPLSPDELIDQILTSMDSASSREQAKNLRDEFLNSLEPSTNPEQTFRDLFEATHDELNEIFSQLETEEIVSDRRLVTLGIRLGQWYDHDPKAAIGFFGEVARTTLMGHLGVNYLKEKLETTLADHGIVNQIPLIQEALRVNFPNFEVLLARTIGHAGNPDDLHLLHETIPHWLNSRTVEEIGQLWTFEERESLLQNIPDHYQISAIHALAQAAEGSEGLDWYLNLCRSKETSPMIRDALRSSYRLRNLIAESEYSIAERANLLKEFEVYRGLDDHGTRARVIFADMSQFLNRENDYLYGSRHGFAPAEVIFNDLVANYPDMRNHEGEVRSQLFRFLSEGNLPEALSLYSDPLEQDWQKVYAARWWFHGASPDQFFGLVNSIQFELEAPQVSIALREAWTSKTYGRLNVFGSDYVEWVKHLPEGQQRQWALEAIATHSDYFPRFASQAQTLLEAP